MSLEAYACVRGPFPDVEANRKASEKLSLDLTDLEKELRSYAWERARWKVSQARAKKGSHWPSRWARKVGGMTLGKIKRPKVKVQWNEGDSALTAVYQLKGKKGSRLRRLQIASPDQTITSVEFSNRRKIKNISLTGPNISERFSGLVNPHADSVRFSFEDVRDSGNFGIRNGRTEKLPALFFPYGVIEDIRRVIQQK